MQNPTVQKIDSIVRRINTHPEYSCLVGRRFTNYLRSEADKHAYAMEHQEQQNDECFDHQMMRTNSLENINSARDFLNKEGLTLISLSRMGKIIEPENHPYGAFRPSNVIFLGYSAPDPTAIHNEIANMLCVLEGNVNISPIIRAAEAHLDFTRIHPYVDGNSRAAFLIQNYFLESNKYPPAVIPFEEKELYLRLMKMALKDRYNGVSSPQKPGYADETFYEYIAENLFKTVESLESKLKDNRTYRLSLSKLRDPGMAFTIQRSLRSIFAKHTTKAQVEFVKGSTPKSKCPKMNIVGNLSYECVIQAVTKVKDKFNSGVKYDIRTIVDCS